MLCDCEKIGSTAIDGNCKGRKLKVGQHVEVETVLVDWIHRCRYRQHPFVLSGPITQMEVGKNL